jgi:predicted thioesterase
MNQNIVIGTKRTLELTVTKELTAAVYGSGLVEVYATPAMIALMERTCQLSVQDQLPEGHLTVGVLVNIRHLKATPVGMKVTCNSELIGVEDRKLMFKVLVNDEECLIGEGFHDRFIVNEEKFMKKLSGK